MIVIYKKSTDDKLDLLIMIKLCKKINIYIIINQPKNLFNILKGAPCGENLNYVHNYELLLPHHLKWSPPLTG